VTRLLVVGAGGFLGAIARYGVGLLVARYWTAEFPLATFLINVSGSFVLGFFSTLAAERLTLDPLWRLLVATGFVGAYTTFSTFEYETQRLVATGGLGWAVLNVAASVAAGYAAVLLGVRLAR
jgi:fluoride exporter